MHCPPPLPSSFAGTLMRLQTLGTWVGTIEHSTSPLKSSRAPGDHADGPAPSVSSSDSVTLKRHNIPFRTGLGEGAEVNGLGDEVRKKAA